MLFADLQEPLLVKKEEEEEKSENHDYSQIPEELWFHGEEVAISVALEDPSAEIPPSVTEDTPDVVTEDTPVQKAVQKRILNIVDRVPKVFEACAQMQTNLSEWKVQHPDKPLIKWADFSLLCSKVPALRRLQGQDAKVAEDRHKDVAQKFIRKKVSKISFLSMPLIQTRCYFYVITNHQYILRSIQRSN